MAIWDEPSESNPLETTRPTTKGHTMNGFTKHGLEHSSPSQINLWCGSPSKWCAQYLFGMKGTFGVAPKIGMLVEDVVADVLTGRDGDSSASMKRAEKQFTKFTALNPNEKDRARITNIGSMSSQALQVLLDYGTPTFNQTLKGRSQLDIDLVCKTDDWALPIKGYMDFVYPEQKLIIDLKTTLKCPAQISDAHQRQGAIYAKAMGDGWTCKMLYVTPKKTALYTVENVDDTMKEVKAILVRQEAYLRYNDKDMIRASIPVDDTFYWKGDEGIRMELFGVKPFIVCPLVVGLVVSSGLDSLGSSQIAIFHQCC